jgi:hypothetical protein
MIDDDKPMVLSVASLTDVRLIDGGDTFAVRFQAPGGREVAVLIPREAASKLDAQISGMLSQPLRRTRDEQSGT